MAPSDLFPLEITTSEFAAFNDGPFQDHISPNPFPKDPFEIMVLDAGFFKNAIGLISDICLVVSG